MLHTLTLRLLDLESRQDPYLSVAVSPAIFRQKITRARETLTSQPGSLASTAWGRHAHNELHYAQIGLATGEQAKCVLPCANCYAEGTTPIASFLAVVINNGD